MNIISCSHLTHAPNEGRDVVFKQTTDFEERRVGHARLCQACYKKSQALGMIIHSEAEGEAWLAGEAD